MAKTSNSCSVLFFLYFFFFCDKDNTREPLHSDKSVNVDTRLHEYGYELQDIKGGIHAVDAKYNR